MVVWQSSSPLIQKITSNDRSSELFGGDVAISGNYAIVGAENNDNRRGAAYIFERNSDGSWNQVEKLVEDERNAYNLFGVKVAISGNYAIVAGSHNRQVLPYVFERNNIGQWNKKQILVSNDLQTDDNFGYSIALTDNYAIVGAIKESHDVTGTSNSTENEAEYIYQAGAAYIFKRDSNGYWNQLQKIVPNDRSEYLYFGYKVAIKGDYAVIAGDQYTIHNTIYDGKGSAYIFERDKTNDSWNQVQKIVASYRQGGDRFGYSVAISGNYAIVGA